MCLCHVVDLDDATFAIIQLPHENLNANHESTTILKTFEVRKDWKVKRAPMLNNLFQIFPTERNTSYRSNL